MYVSVEKKKSSSVLIKFSLQGLPLSGANWYLETRKKIRADKLQAGL